MTAAGGLTFRNTRRGGSKRGGVLRELLEGRGQAHISHAPGVSAKLWHAPLAFGFAALRSQLRC